MTEHEKDQERNDLHPTQEEVVLALLAEWASGDRDPHDPRLLHASKEMLAQAKVEVFVRLACDAKDAVIFPELLEDAPENVLTPAQRERLQNEAIPLFLANNGGDILKRFDLLRRYGIDVDEAMRTPNAREAALGSLELRMMTADVPSEWKEYAEALQMTQEDMRHAAARAMLYISDKRRLGELNTYGVTHEDSRSAAREIVEECVERGNVSGITAEFLNRFSLPDLFSSEQMDALYARIEDHAVRLLHSGKARDVVAILEMHRLLPLKNDISERRNLIEPLRNILAKVVEEEAINTWGSLGGARTFRDFEEERSKWGGTQRLTFTNVDELLVALAPTSRTPEDRAAFAAYYSARLKGMDGLLVVEEDIREGKVNELFSWTPGVRLLARAQPHAKNALHDPWRTDLGPLVGDALRDGTLAVERADDIDHVTTFVKRFGAKNLPKLFRAWVALREAPTVDAIASAVATEIRAFVGEDVFARAKSPDALIESMVNTQREMMTAVLRDELPSTLDTQLGAELFMQAIGKGEWGGGDATLVDNIAALRAAKSEHPELVTLPEGYVPHTFSVHLRERVQRTPDEKMKRVFMDKDLQKTLHDYRWACIAGERGAGDSVLRERIDAVIARCTKRIQGMKKRLQSAPESARTKMEADIQRAETQRHAFASVVSSPLLNDRELFPQAMEEIVRLELDSKEELDLLRALSAAHIMDIAPDFHGRMFTLADRLPEECTEESVRALNALAIDYIAEHYLAEDPAHAGHMPFTPALRRRLEKVWRLVGGKKVFPSVSAVKKLDALSQGSVGGETVLVTMVPSQGLMRVYSGRVGDSCHAQLEYDLAQGEYPGLRSYTFVTDWNTPEQRFVGSVLFIETRTEDDTQDVLVVRADNPQENFIQSVNADEFVAHVVQEAQAVATRRAIDHTLGIRDNRSEANSNRQLVSDANAKLVAEGATISLARTPETNFNTYRIWDADGDHPCVALWSRPGAQSLASRKSSRKKRAARDEGSAAWA